MKQLVNQKIRVIILMVLSVTILNSKQSYSQNSGKLADSPANDPVLWLKFNEEAGKDFTAFCNYSLSLRRSTYLRRIA